MTCSKCKEKTNRLISSEEGLFCSNCIAVRKEFFNGILKPEITSIYSDKKGNPIAVDKRGNIVDKKDNPYENDARGWKRAGHKNLGGYGHRRILIR